MDEQRVHPCPLSECTFLVEGVREQPNASRGPSIAQALGVHSAFFGDQWLFDEAKRVEDELQRHLESHRVLEFVLEITRLRRELIACRERLDQ